MKHSHNPWFFWYHEGCARCKVRQFVYGYRFDPIGYMEERNKIWSDERFTVAERLWILDHVRVIEIED